MVGLTPDATLNMNRNPIDRPETLPKRQARASKEPDRKSASIEGVVLTEQNQIKIDTINGPTEESDRHHRERATDIIIGGTKKGRFGYMV